MEGEASDRLADGSYLTEFFNLGAVGTLDWIVPCWGGCARYTQTCSSTRGLYSLDASGAATPSCDYQKCRHCRIVPGGQTSPQ